MPECEQAGGPNTAIEPEVSRSERNMVLQPCAAPSMEPSLGESLAMSCRREAAPDIEEQLDLTAEFGGAFCTPEGATSNIDRANYIQTRERKPFWATPVQGISSSWAKR